MHMRNRYYDPNSGRFTQEDPIGLAGGLNLYGFANGDPINFSDPFGLCPVGEKCRRYTFGHLASIDVTPGDIVNAGDQLGLSGNTGHSTNPHLHYELGDVDEKGNYTPEMTAGPATDGCPLGSCDNVTSTPAGNRCLTDGTQCRTHYGTDIAVPRGSRVTAPKRGEVIRAGYEDEQDRKKGLGLRVTVDVVVPDQRP
jgi:murein DD-endopeptidase MepM/ murein hydrolase activator NlpD